MKISKVVNDARAQGHTVRVKVTHEADGGKRVRVISIDGQKYSGKDSKGNNALRQIMGQELTAKQRAQRQAANIGGSSAEEQGAQREKHRVDKKLPILSKKERARLRRMNAKVHKTGHGYKMSTRQFRKMKKERGKEETEKQMRRRETAARGDVYNEKVDEFIRDMQYIIDQERPGASQARRVIAFFNSHGRQGKEGKYKFFKGHSISDDAFHSAHEKSYHLADKDGDEAYFKAIADEVLDILKAGVKIDGKLVNK